MKKTGVELRHSAKQRLKKFREEKEKVGFKNITILTSQELREELTRLQNESHISRQQALDLIFQTYQRYCHKVSRNVTSKINENKPNTFINPPNQEVHCQTSNTTPKIKTAIQGMVDSPLSPEPFLPVSHGLTLSIQEREHCLLQVERMFPGKGKNRLRADALNHAGIKTGHDSVWTAKKVGDCLRLLKIKLSNTQNNG